MDVNFIDNRGAKNRLPFPQVMYSFYGKGSVTLKLSYLNCNLFEILLTIFLVLAGSSPILPSLNQDQFCKKVYFFAQIFLKH